ncbi:MAG: hypothetical protein IT429_02680 [Gemmataceae bacterium]|nr:hypothetical protein [Gemmataceae bacterium]
MRFWIRELAGWLLVGLGLFVFYICFAVLLSDGSLLLESIPLTVIGVVIYRSGIHLLKIAVAARACLHAQALLREEAARPADRAGLRQRSRRPTPERLAGG